MLLISLRGAVMLMVPVNSLSIKLDLTFEQRAHALYMVILNHDNIKLADLTKQPPLLIVAQSIEIL